MFTTDVCVCVLTCYRGSERLILKPVELLFRTNSLYDKNILVRWSCDSHVTGSGFTKMVGSPVCKKLLSQSLLFKTQISSNAFHSSSTLISCPVLHLTVCIFLDEINLKQIACFLDHCLGLDMIKKKKDWFCSQLKTARVDFEGTFTKMWQSLLNDHDNRRPQSMTPQGHQTPYFWRFMRDHKRATIHRSSDMVREAVLLGEGILCLDDAQQRWYRRSTWVLHQQQPITATRVIGRIMGSGGKPEVRIRAPKLYFKKGFPL